MNFFQKIFANYFQKIFVEFFKSESASAVLLLVVTLVSIVLANTPFRENYMDFWHMKVAVPLPFVDLNFSIRHWINDGLMVFFFLMVGLEVEESMYIGELSDFKSAALPIIAAIGGLMLPALFYLGFNWGLETQPGFGIPMATDIAFSIGILALLGKRVPFALKIFLTAVAVVDDVGAIIIIVIFYSQSLNYFALMIAAIILAALLIMNRLKAQLLLYIIPGILLWYFTYKAGIHPTIAGVILAFVIPFGDGGEGSPSYELLHFLTKPVAFFVMPVFAIANATILFEADWASSLMLPASLGTIFGLILGKPLGIVGLSLLAIWLGVAKLPENVSKNMILGVGFISGIGFTMSIFITNLAFVKESLINDVKIAIIVASATSGIIGYLWLNYILNRKQKDKANELQR